ncbi:site-specific integrase [bacterium CPR1]|nr:site-specific integrase [bacterium CPR1]
MRMLAYPPSADVDPPRMPRERKVRALSKAQLEAFLAAAAGDRWQALWMLAVQSGCRPEEILGLKWHRVLWDHSAISIEEVLIRPRKRNGGAAWWLDAPKTRNSRRIVTLPLPVMRALEKHRLKQNEEKAFYGAEYCDHGFVFASRKGEPVRDQRLSSEFFKAVLEKAGLPASTRLYDLRHSHASMMLAHGMDAKVVSERMGHSSVAFTLDVYVHLVEDQQKQAAQLLDRLFYGASAG